MTPRAIAIFIALAPGLWACETVTEQPPCGEGTVRQSDGTCAVDPTTCGAGTELRDGQCLPIEADADTSEPEDVEPIELPDIPGIGPSDVECVPSCEGRVCGDDGCGGSCGDCAGGATCNVAGACVEPGWTCSPDNYGEGNGCHCGCGIEDPDCGPTALVPTLGCDAGESCVAGVCGECVPRCFGNECGDDGCGGTCGKCYDPARPFCQEGRCVDTCVPKCDGLECGSDGCGGSCGVCGAGQFCVIERCLDLPAELSCQGQCGQSVTAGGCSCSAGCAGPGCCGDVGAACGCVPNCTGRECGDDGCGGTCGAGCSEGVACLEGQCVSNPCEPDPCTVHGTCDAGLCLCDHGYGGRDCGLCLPGYIGYPNCRLDPCLGQSCSGAGTCDSTTGACVCNPGFTGAVCDQCSDEAASFPTCDQPDPCYGVFCHGRGTCNPTTAACVCEAGFTGARCDQCSNATPATPWPGCGVACTEDSQCLDADGCTIDTCEGGQCKNVGCARSTVKWSQISTVPETTSAASPFVFPIDAQTEVSFHRDNAWPTSDYTPVTATNGSFVCEVLAGVSLGWEGAFTYININTPPGAPRNEGNLVFDFGEAATTRGATWRYLVGVAALGFAGTGPTDIVFSEPLEELGRFDAFGTGLYATFDGDRTLSAPAGDNHGMQFFALPAAAASVTLTIDDRGTVGPDTFGVWVGAVDIDVVTCERGSPLGDVCVANFCGDGILGPGEACDDSDNDNGDGCTSGCKVESGFACRGAIRSVCSAL